MESGDPFQLIDVLTKHNVPFVVIGGHAVTFHGYVRATEDSDIVFLRSPESERSLLSALQELNAERIGDELDPSTGIEKTHPVNLAYIQASHLLMLITKFGFLDIFDFIPGHSSISVVELFDTAELNGGRRFSSLAWLRKMKSVASRPKDLIDLQNLPLPNESE